MLWILDLDGTVYRGTEALPFAAEVVQELIRRGDTVRYLTNNSSAKPKAISEKLNGMGIPCEPRWVYGAGPASARYCKEQEYERVFVVGEPSLHQMVEAEGIGIGERADAVLVGICRTFTYDLMNGALQEILRGADYIATNLDATYPLEGGRLEPGAGAVVAGITEAAGREPLVIGKPEPLMIQQILADTGAKPEEAMVVGDRAETDLEAGRRAGCPTWLVLTGVTTAPIAGQLGSADLQGLLEYRA